MFKFHLQAPRDERVDIPASGRTAVRLSAGCQCHWHYHGVHHPQRSHAARGRQTTSMLANIPRPRVKRARRQRNAVTRRGRRVTRKRRSREPRAVLFRVQIVPVLHLHQLWSTFPRSGPINHNVSTANSLYNAAKAPGWLQTPFHAWKRRGNTHKLRCPSRPTTTIRVVTTTHSLQHQGTLVRRFSSTAPQRQAPELLKRV